MVRDLNSLWLIELFWIEDGLEERSSTYFLASSVQDAKEAVLRFIRNRQYCLRDICWQRLGALKMYQCDPPSIDEQGKLTHQMTQFPCWEWKYDTHPRLEGVT